MQHKIPLQVERVKVSKQARNTIDGSHSHHLNMKMKGCLHHYTQQKFQTLLLPTNQNAEIIKLGRKSKSPHKKKWHLCLILPSFSFQLTKIQRIKIKLLNFLVQLLLIKTKYKQIKYKNSTTCLWWSNNPSISNFQSTQKIKINDWFWLLQREKKKRKLNLSAAAE